MPATLDSCIGNKFFPGNIPSDAGLPPAPPVTPEFIPSLDFSISIDSQYFFLLLLW